jgi:hypothetical protein
LIARVSHGMGSQRVDGSHSRCRYDGALPTSGMQRLWRTSKRFSRGTRPMSARAVEFHKYQMMEVNGLRSSAELIHFAIKDGIAII